MRFSAAFTALLPLQKLVANRLPLRSGTGHPSPPQPAPNVQTRALPAVLPVHATLPPASERRCSAPVPEDLDQRVRELGEW